MKVLKSSEKAGSDLQ